VVGCFFILVILAKFYFKYQYTVGDWIIFLLLLTPFIAMVTWFWHQKLSHQKIESIFGSIFFTKRKTFTNLQSIELDVGDNHLKNASDTLFLTIDMKIEGRKELIGIFTKKSWRKCSSDEIVKEIKEISKVTGVSAINVSGHFKSMYQKAFNKEFTLD
jgi:phosphatidylglycerophosphate synthase